MNISPFLSIDCSCDEAMPWTKEQLSQAGLRPVQTFDLHTTRAGLHDCPCPHHGTDKCDCQMIVMLVYGKTEEPVTLILHGNDGQTWLSLVDNSILPTDESIQSIIQRTLQPDPFP